MTRNAKRFMIRAPILMVTAGGTIWFAPTGWVGGLACVGAVLGVSAILRAVLPYSDEQ
jgi:hypothetical protein